MGHSSWAFPGESWDTMLHSHSWRAWDLTSVGSCHCRGDKQRWKAQREKVTGTKLRSRTSPSEEHSLASPKLTLVV